MEIPCQFSPVIAYLFKKTAQIHPEHGQRHGAQHMFNREALWIQNYIHRDRSTDSHSLIDGKAYVLFQRSFYRPMGIAAKAISKGSLRRPFILIVVLVGTNPYNFTRLVQFMDDYARVSGEEVFIQLGHTQYCPSFAVYERFLSKKELIEKVRQADLVIAQGGFGSIADCLIEGKKVIAVPRKPELNEAPDRQEELVRELEKLDRIIGVYEIKDLTAAIKQARNRDFAEGNAHRIPSLVKEFIKNNE